METIKPIEIPQSHIDFANAVAELAEKNGIAEFTLEYGPDWHEGQSWDRRVRNKARIIFAAKDGRGRPCRNLKVLFDASFSHEIESNLPSSRNGKGGIVKRSILMAIVGCICWLSVAQAEQCGDVFYPNGYPIYTQKEYKDGYNTAATLGANVGIWCMASYPITGKTKSAEAHMEKITKCIEDKLRERGVTFIRDDR